MKTSFSIRIAFFFILSFLAVSCHRDTDALNMTFSKVEKCMDLCPDSALNLLKGIMILKNCGVSHKRLMLF